MDARTAVPAAIATGVVLGLILAAAQLPTPIAALAVGAPASVDSTEVAWDLPVVRNASVQRFVDLLERKQPDRMALYLKRSGRYEGMIRQKLRDRGMPEDLLYLSMIESGFDPTARSNAEAVGLWQFVEETARRYGLRIDEYVDERRDPERSTDAAVRYLQDLHAQFGSWSLAAAAYNSGENRIARIMRNETGRVRGREDDFWRIRSALPAETREYVPLLFAVALIGKEPQKYGLDDVERLLPIPLDQVEVPGGTSLETIAAATGLPVSQIRHLNPHLLRGVTPPGEPYPVYVPEERSRQFARNFDPVTGKLRGTLMAARVGTR